MLKLLRALSIITLLFALPSYASYVTYQCPSNGQFKSISIKGTVGAWVVQCLYASGDTYGLVCAGFTPGMGDKWQSGPDGPPYICQGSITECNFTFSHDVCRPLY